MNDIQEYLIPGTPATYATAGEKPWKIQLEQNIPRYPSESCFSGIKMQFVLPTPAPHGMPLDVDNLCEPVFSIVVNKLGWFESKRQNIRWWQATKECGAPTGLRIEMMQDTEINIGLTPDGIIFDAIYDGDMPASAKDCQVASWAEKNYLARSCPEPNRRYSMLIQFASPTINIGDIATGKVKSFIDCMYPAIGGSAGKPEDWRIDLLQVEKGVQTLAGNTVRICIWDKKRSGGGNPRLSI